MKDIDIWSPVHVNWESQQSTFYNPSDTLTSLFHRLLKRIIEGTWGSFRPFSYNSICLKVFSRSIEVKILSTSVNACRFIYLNQACNGVWLWSQSRIEDDGGTATKVFIAENSASARTFWYSSLFLCRLLYKLLPVQQFCLFKGESERCYDTWNRMCSWLSRFWIPLKLQLNWEMLILHSALCAVQKLKNVCINW